jgi:acetyl-CoA carboxylase biotin carboxyl carrier protein
MDFVQIQKIIKDFEKSNLSALELEFDNVKIKLVKGSNNSIEEIVLRQPAKVEVVEKNEVVAEPKGFQVKSPLVGTFYAARSPKEEPLVKVGQSVSKGDTICIIEAMKIMNEITAPVSGTITEVHAKNGLAVGFDQLLVTIA